jgi:hypothetical protein
MTRLALVAGLALALAACASAPGPKPGPMPPLPPVHIPTMESCDKAQAKLEELECKRDDGAPYARTKGGTPFAEACRRALADGRPWMSNCISRIPDCSYLHRAYRGEWCGEPQ